MSTYIYISTDSVNVSANLATDKIRIATTDNPILYAVGYPNVAGTGNITSAINSSTVTGNSTSFTTELGVGYWIGNSTGSTVGIVKSIANANSLILTTNATTALSDEEFTYTPYGVPYVDDTLDPSNCPRASGIIPSNTVENSIFVGQGNVVAFVNAGDSNATFSITELGMPYSNTGTTGY
jgi:hypothetical protein